MCALRWVNRMGNSNGKNYLVIYERNKKKFSYPDALKEEFDVEFDERPMGEIFAEKGILLKEDAEEWQEIIDRIAKSADSEVCFEEYFMRNKENRWKWYRIGFISPMMCECIEITISDIEEMGKSTRITQAEEYDQLTGLFNMHGFSERVERMTGGDEQGVKDGKYALVCFDVVRFKAINDLFGTREGDRLLQYIATVTCKMFPEAIVARPGYDHYLVFTSVVGCELEERIERLLTNIGQFGLSFEITCNVGIYVTNEVGLPAEAMVNRAILAQDFIKGSYTQSYHYYTEELRDKMLGEQEIAGIMGSALAQKQFVVFYQPQYNHSTGMLVGAEALVRWMHPERGIISPGVFIPIFEKNGFITKLDMYVFEQVCSFIRSCMDRGYAVVPISTNFSRHDIYQPDFVEKLEEIRSRYDVPSKYLRVEMTESAVVGSNRHVNDIIKKLHQFGYVVEMDDFGSGYSSLNVLKDVELDVIKLDMLFLVDDSENNRGGTIVSAVIRMAKWLDVPVIAEGVETIEQADFLKSIGCDYIQGYLYAKPMPQEAYEELINKSAVGATVPQMKLIDTLNACDFWDPNSQETLIFSNYVGGAAIFDYHDNQVEILRVNKKYLQEMGMNNSERDIIESDPMAVFDELNAKVYMDMLERAIETGEEQECETWRTVRSSCCGEEYVCIRSNVRMVGKSDDNYLFYAMIRNITAEKNRYAQISDSERRFKMASEQANIYYWEYTIATKEMRPCFRCMRDLGFPALLTNYPDSAIQMGVFPPEYAEMYRDWHKQIEQGVESFEAVIPLTIERIPFTVRYTTEFDENGRPIKAYGSATLVVEN